MIVISKLFQGVQQQLGWPVTSHSPTRVLHTIAAWNTMDIIGVQLPLDGEFAQALARLLWNGQ